jgi:hypothetical protein
LSASDKWFAAIKAGPLSRDDAGQVSVPHLAVYGLRLVQSSMSRTSWKYGVLAPSNHIQCLDFIGVIDTSMAMN